MSTYAAWCRSLFESINEGGVWGIPRSGLVFRKKGETLVLFDRMPYSADMPITAEQLWDQQEAEFESVKENFALAGIEVIKPDIDFFSFAVIDGKRRASS